MALSPVEIHHVKLGRGLLGYRQRPVDDLLTEVRESFEEVWRERADLSDKVEHLEGELQRHRELETLLRTTLVSAERAAHDLKDGAQAEARRIVDEAHAEARAITRAAVAERERLLAECRRVRALLGAALETVETAGDESDDPSTRENGENGPPLARVAAA